jgi:cytidylate kinase
LRVRIIAPLAFRVRNVSARHGVPEEIATALVEARDRARTAYVQRFYGRDANDPELYDMTLNMARLSIPAAVDLICQAAAEVSPHAVEVGP